MNDSYRKGMQRDLAVSASLKITVVKQLETDRCCYSISTVRSALEAAFTVLTGLLIKVLERPSQTVPYLIESF